MLIGVVSLFINVLLMKLLISPLAQGGLALAMSVSAIVNMLLLLYLLRRRIGSIDGGRILNSFLKITLASLVMGVMVYFVSGITTALVYPGKIGSLITLLVGTAVGAAVFGSAAFLLHMPELEFLTQTLRRRTK